MTFFCTEDGCLETFRENSDLQSHLDIGSHIREAERLTLTDFALKTYKSKLEQFAILPQIPFLQEALSPIEQRTTSGHEMVRGWALTAKKKENKMESKANTISSRKVSSGTTNRQKMRPARSSQGDDVCNGQRQTQV